MKKWCDSPSPTPPIAITFSQQSSNNNNDEAAVEEQSVQRDLTRRKSFLPVDFETRKALMQHHQHKVSIPGTSTTTLE